jgi:hypothetical protein
MCSKSTLPTNLWARSRMNSLRYRTLKIFELRLMFYAMLYHCTLTD